MMNQKLITIKKMKLYHNNYYIKLIPDQFLELENITDYLEDEFEKRLSKRERKNIKSAILQQRVSKVLLPALAANDPLVLEQIKGALPIKTYKVTTNDHQVYYVVEFDNRCKVRGSEAVYRISPVCGQLKYAACLSTNRIPPPAREQLRLFEETI
jgi:hypothetical protein